jgi:outer membrane usher protein FimD/PapC
LSNNPTAQAQAANDEDTLQQNATQGHLGVTNHQGVPEQYELKLLVNGKLTGNWSITLNDGQSWQKTIVWHTTNYAMLADLYLLPNTTTPFHYVNNGACISNIKLLPTVLKVEDPCDGKAP